MDAMQLPRTFDGCWIALLVSDAVKPFPAVRRGQFVVHKRIVCFKEILAATRVGAFSKNNSRHSMDADDGRAL